MLSDKSADIPICCHVYLTQNTEYEKSHHLLMNQSCHSLNVILILYVNTVPSTSDNGMSYTTSAAGKREKVALQTSSSWITTMCRAVFPFVSFLLTSAPLACSSRTHSSWPRQEAKLRGYSPQYAFLRINVTLCCYCLTILYARNKSVQINTRLHIDFIHRYHYQLSSLTVFITIVDITRLRPHWLHTEKSLQVFSVPLQRHARDRRSFIVVAFDRVVIVMHLSASSTQ